MDWPSILWKGQPEPLRTVAPTAYAYADSL